MKEPTRLLDDGEVAQSLRDALRALEQRSPSPDVLCRVEHALNALPAAPAATAALSLSATITATALVALAIATAVIVHTREPSPSRRTASPVVQTEPARSASTQLPPAPATAVLPVLAPATPARERPNRLKPRGQAKAGPARTALPATASEATPAEPITPADVVEQSPSSNTANPSNQAAQTQPQPSAAEAEPALPTPAVPQDEAGLLYRAKRLSSHDPTAALTLLELHAHHFPDSAFRQEREVLVIKLHQRLGHVELVRQLAAQFRARFPSSVYRLSVEP